MSCLSLKDDAPQTPIAFIPEIARRYSEYGRFFNLPPPISLMAVVGPSKEAVGDVAQFAARTRAALWYVIPSLPLFLILPALLERQVNFWIAMTLASAITVCLYLLAIWIAGRLGITFG